MAFLLNIDSNAKTVKGQAQGYLTGVLYLQPSPKLCPNASPGCLKACLNTAGRGAFSNVQKARKRKSELLANNRDMFLTLLVRDIRTLIRKAERKGLIPVVRLNGTSDIRWEDMVFEWSEYYKKAKSYILRDKLEIKKKKHEASQFNYAFTNVLTTLFDMFPDVQFYDYTKNSLRMFDLDMPSNYHLTFSLSETNAKEALQVLKAGKNITIVFQNPPPEGFEFDFFDGLGLEPDTRSGWVNVNGRVVPIYSAFPVIDGDKNDLRFLDPSDKGYIVALKAKGKARKDDSGFAIA